MKTVNKFWDNFYKNFNLRKPTSFGKFVNKNFIRKKKNLLEVGCGNGRDSFYLSKKVKIISIDKSAETIKQNLIILRKIKKKNFYFKKLDAIRLATIKLVKFNYIYARFFLHTINLSSEKKKDWQNLKMTTLQFVELS